MPVSKRENFKLGHYNLSRHDPFCRVLNMELLQFY